MLDAGCLSQAGSEIIYNSFFLHYDSVTLWLCHFITSSHHHFFSIHLEEIYFQMMQLISLSPRKSLNKAYLKVKPTRSNIERFKINLIGLLDGLDESESEEHNKNDLGDFLKNTFYHPKFYINTKDRTDLVIHNGNDAKGFAGVLIEAKKPSNKTEMIRPDNLNAKAFHELILYYMSKIRKNIMVKGLFVRNILSCSTKMR
jgi:hypothetical protein